MHERKPCLRTQQFKDPFSDKYNYPGIITKAKNSFELEIKKSFSILSGAQFCISHTLDLNLGTLVLKQALNINGGDQTKRIIQIKAEIEKHRSRINTARKKVLEGIWEDEDLIETKKLYLRKLKKGRGIVWINPIGFNPNEEIEFCTQFIANLPHYYQPSELIAQRQIIGFDLP